jgi:hypothetical protein
MFDDRRAAYQGVEGMAKLSKIERDLLERLMKQKESATRRKTVRTSFTGQSVAALSPELKVRRRGWMVYLQDQRRREYAGVKKRKMKRKAPGPKKRARDLVEEFG